MEKYKRKIEFVSLRITSFYLKTPSPFKSKIKVFFWFTIRGFIRTVFGFKRMKFLLKKMEKWKISSRMVDGANFFHIIEQLSNLYEFYGKKNQESKKYKTVPNIIVDVGAHIGIYTIKCAYVYPKAKIYSIEPEEENFKLLEKNIYLNNLEKRVVPLKLAFFNKRGYMKLALDEFRSGQHSLLKSCKKMESVKVITLDDFLDKINKKIDLIKIDTEGSEYNVLLGGLNCLNKDKPNLIIETHPWYDERIDKKIISLLKQLGYKISIKKNDGSTIFGWV